MSFFDTDEDDRDDEYEADGMWPEDLTDDGWSAEEDE